MSSTTNNSFAKRIMGGFHNKLSVKNVIAVTIFGMIIVVFVLSGALTGNSSGTVGSGVAATVNGDIISLKQYQEQYNKISNYYSQMLGGQFEQLFQKQQLASETMNQLINTAVAYQAGEKEHIYASDAHVRDAIQDLPYFKRDGAFQTDLYRGLLQANNMTPAEFEKGIRQEIVIQKVRDLFESSSVATQLEKSAEAHLRAQKINLEYVQIDPKKVDSEGVKKIEEALAVAGADLKSVAKANGLTVKETGFFDISTEAVPQIGSAAAFKAAMELEKGQSSKIINDNEFKYVVSLKDVKVDAESSVDPKMVEFLTLQKPYQYYQKWVNQHRAKFDVSVNNELLQ